MQHVVIQVVTGAMGSLLPKLGSLLRDEYNLQKGVKKDIRFLSRELTMMHAALCKVAEVPPDDLDPQLRLWAAQVRELSYDMEDIVDTFLVRVRNGGNDPNGGSSSSKGLAKKMVGLLKKGMTRHQIAKEIKYIKDRVQEVADRRDRYKLDSVLANTTSTAIVDPRISALYKKATDLVGVEGARDELIGRLSEEGDDVLNNKALKIVSVAGPGGLGKTTLAKAVYDTLKEQFDCYAFVPLSRNPNTKKVLQDIFLELDKQEYLKLAAAALDERQLINELIEFLKHKRYTIVLDDIWDISTWEVVRNALQDNSCGSRIVATTRISDVAKEVGDVYNLKPLSNENSKKLFYTRIFGGDGASVEDSQMDEAPDKILKKCGGLPLSIITIASLLVGKPREEWSKVYDSIGFGDEDNRDVHNTRKILSFSYYDLPSHLKACLLYLSIFPEDYNIRKNYLIWRWIAEGFVCEKQGMCQYEVGERYFNDLINRSMIQPTEHHNGIIVGCHVHDMVLDLIRTLSTNENFVAILDKEQDTLPESNVRRLAVHKRNIEEHKPKASMGMPQVRSLNAITCTITAMPQLSSFRVLRVLAVEYCDFTESYSLEHLGKLLHLRYVSLVNTPIAELPSEVGSLKFLQGLDVRRTGVEELPSTIGELKQLMCLCADGDTRVPAGMGNLTKLQELRLHSIDKSPSFAAELAELTEVRYLEMWFNELDESSQQALLSSMSNLHKVQTVEVWCGTGEWAHIGDWEGWDPSSQLRFLALIWIIIPRVPSWIDSSRVPHLSHLHLGVELVEARDLDTLGRLPVLRFLYLSTGNKLPYRPAGSDDGRRPMFQNLRFIQTNLQLTFPRGAMPALLILRDFGVNVRSVADAAAASGAGFDDVLGLGNVPLLERFEVRLYCAGARLREVEEVEATVRRAIRMLPNSPTWCFRITRKLEEEMILDDPGSDEPGPQEQEYEDGHDNDSPSGDGAVDDDRDM